MYIEIYPTHNKVPKGILKGKNVIIIDVLRASSVIITALSNGASKVRTFPTINAAFAEKAKYPACLLGGERNTIKIEGFDFGNSPLEYTVQQVENKEILLCTSNGTKAIHKALNAKLLIAAAFVNLNSVVEFADKLNENFSIICSGTLGNFSMDDGYCAGLIIHHLRKYRNISTCDLGEVLSYPFINNDFNLKDLLQSAAHVKYLSGKGFSGDVDYCLNLNILTTIPIWNRDGFIKLIKTANSN